MVAHHSWRSAFSVYLKPRVSAMVVLGFSAGLPYLLVFSTLSAWLRDEGIELTVIGFFSWVSVIYSIKVLWAPVVDRLPIPFLTGWLGKRRSWMLCAQIGIALGLAGMSRLNVQSQLHEVALLAVIVAFCSATQDVAIDAFRIETADKHYQGAMAAAYVLGYRLAFLAAGAGAFYIAEYASWGWAYATLAAAMTAGMIATLWLKEPVHTPRRWAEISNNRNAFSSELTNWKAYFERLISTLSEAVLSPFVDFFSRNGKTGLMILLLIAVYKMSDITMGVMANPFYLDLGFSKTDIAEVSKIFGFFMTIAGAALGGVFVVRYGIMKPLLMGSVMVVATNLLFAMLALSPPSKILLALVISADNLSGGLATSVFVAYLSSLTSQSYTATQYALFSSLMTLPAQFLGGFAGLVVDSYGYYVFFIYASVVGLPAIFLVLLLKEQEESRLTNS